MNCEDMLLFLDSLMDGELLPPQLYDVQAHLRVCTECRDRLALCEAIADSTRKAVHAEPIPTALSARIQAAIADVRDDELRNSSPAIQLDSSASDASPSASKGQATLRRAMSGLALAAAVLLYFAGQQSSAPRLATTPVVQSTTASVPTSPEAVSSSVESMLDRLLDFHASPPPLSATDPEVIARFEPDVGVRVQVPSFERYGGLLQGGSVIPIRKHHAVRLRYRLSNHDVTLYVYNSARVPVHHRLERRIVRDRPIYVGRRRGYQIAVAEHHGLGYAIAADLSDRETAELVAGIH
ncbi:MAG: hypothetical protein HRU17_11205 [Polyangiaceae bacterium]|nr:hypothetical protein [Polyangiaceae bacterium]